MSLTAKHIKMEVKKRFDKFKLLENGKKECYCESCGSLHSPWDQVIMPDNAWKEISKETGCNILCRKCIEEHLGRKLTLDDLFFYDNKKTIMVPANFKLCRELNDGRGLRYMTWEEYDKYFNSKGYKFYYSKRDWDELNDLYEQIFDKQ